jgi:FkbH-like protein
MWIQAWKIVNESLGARLLQVGYDWVTPGAPGTHLAGRPQGRVHAVRTLNEEIRAHLPAGAYFLDVEQVSGAMGRESFYDMRRYYWTKQPFSEEGTVRLAAELWAGIRALTSGPKKVLVLDLDNTLWGGVVGETGPLGVALGDSPDGEGFRAFQAHVKDLTRRGIVLAVASKNNPDDAREVFEKNPDMILRLDDFAAFEAHWDPKAVSIRRIAETLNLGLDSFVFFDDNPAEAELIRQALPEVEVVDVPAEPAEYVRTLQAGGWFETTGLTKDDAARSAQYVVERKRREHQESFTSLGDYLRSLEMRGDVRDIGEEDLMRVVQLLAKTNQFNLTTRRHTREDVLALIEPSGSVAITLRMQDRFGDYGLVSVLIGVPDHEPGTVRIDTWLMSCRVIGRTAEQFFFGTFLARSKELGYRRIVGEYIPTRKNALVKDLLDAMGFTRLTGDAGGVRYELLLDAEEPPVSFITPGGKAVEAAELVEI